MKISLLTLVLLAFLAGSVGAQVYTKGDLNKDWIVDLADLRRFVEQWLDDPACLVHIDDCADLNYDSKVNMSDFTQLAKNWQAERASLVISEFMASNGSTLATTVDGQEEYPDWIEIYNPTSANVSLDGWYLTDSNSNLTKWQFPDGLTIGAGGFLIVFASNKDIEDDPNNYPYLDQAGYYHTNFNLSKDPGEYLALVEADGNTIAHEYALEYPKQLTDISYGLSQYATTLVPTFATASYHVPTISDVGANWTELDFNDSAWNSGPTGLGFGDAGVGTGTILREYWTGIEGSAVSDLTSSPDFPDNPSGSDYLTSFEAPTDWADYYGTYIRGYLHPPTSGDYTFWIASDDASELWLSTDDNPANKVMIANVPGWSNSREWTKYAEQRSASITLTGGHRYYIEALQKEQGGGDNLAVAWEGPTFGFDVINGQYLSPWTGGVINTDVQEDMLGVNASLWARLEFDLEEGAADIFDILTLRMKYEDGFAAYLNGQRVEGSNAPGSLYWNSTADFDRPLENSSVFENFNLMAYLGTLQSGNNVLAIHGLNDSKDDDAFLVLPELIAASNQSVPQYFSTATPGTFNVSGAIDVVEDVEFSHERGFYDSQFRLTLCTYTDGAEIRYTLDGSRPTINHGFTYTGQLNVNETTTIRAVAVKPGFLDSDVETHTYIFINDVINQSHNGEAPGPDWPIGSVNSQVLDYGMDPDVVVNDPRYVGLIYDALLAVPTISLVTDLANLFDSATGIYVHAGSSGRSWERPTSVELINPDGTEGFQINAGLRIRGGYSRGSWNPKHAFRLFFRSEYGPARLEYPLFEDEGVDEFENVDLRTSQNYSWAHGQGSGRHNTMVREVFSRDLQGEMGHPYTRSRYYHLYLNGHYWGLFQTQERSEASHAESYLGGDKNDYDVVKTPGMLATDGNRDALDRLYDETMLGLDDSERYYRVQGLNTDGTRNPNYERLLDVDNVIDFMIIEYYTGDRDGPASRYTGRPNNTYGIYNRVNPDGWKWFHHDNEHALGAGSAELNMVEPFSTYGAQKQHFNPHWLHEQLANTNIDYRLHFADHVYKHFFNNGLLDIGQARNRIINRMNQIEMAIIAESGRWGDGRDYHPARTKDDDWLPEIDDLLYDTSDRRHLTPRVAEVLSQFRNVGWYPDVEPPTFNQHGGEVPRGFDLTMSKLSGTIWYTTDGNDPRLPTTSAPPGTSTTLVAEDAAKRVLVPTNDIGNTWRTALDFNDSGWNDGTIIPGKTGGVGYEASSGYENYITYDVYTKMYNQNGTCYIRIPFVFNGDPNDFNFMTLKIRYDDGFIAYLNDDPNELARRNFTGTPVWNSAASGQNGDSAAVNFENIPVSDHISALRQGDNVLAIHGLNFGTTSTDFLISVELVAGETDPSGILSSSAIEYTAPITLTESTHVMARVLDGATWSPLSETTFAVGPVAESLRITEIMYHPQDTGDPNNDPNAEFIELKNIGTETINLSLVRFTKGIDFTFPGRELAPDGYVLVAKDQTVFASRYTEVPPGVDILGPYEGRLSNGGEQVVLEDAIGQTILDFEYSDSWRSITDGDGFSLTIIEPNDSVLYVSDESLVAHWRFDDGFGTIAMDSVGTNDGNLIGDPTWTAGRMGGALSFDGDGDYIALSSISALAGDSVTAEAWIRLNDSGVIWSPILIQRDPNNKGYYLGVSNDRFSFFLIGYTGFAQAISSDTINANQWYHVAGTNDGYNLKMHVDGHLTASGSSDGLAGVDQNSCIGYDDAYPGYYSGLIDDVRIYNRALREDEFQDIADPMKRWSREKSWRTSAYVGGSPGDDDSGILPDPGAIVINEVLSHSHLAPDWIELYNTTGAAIDISGWFLSDSDSNLMKYRIPDGTTIAGSGPNKYKVFYEDLHFGDGNNPGSYIPFAFSENGEVACLSSAEGGVLTGYREVEDFGASETGVSFGRYFKSSTGNYNFVSMDYNTPGALNAPPKVGPIVINEIMYNPDWPDGGLYNNDDYEYIELHNITGSPVTLYDSVEDEPWKFTDGIEFTFSDSPNEVVIPAGKYLLVVKNPAAFAWRYPSVPLPPERILGPYDGRLRNSGERVGLSKPGDVDTEGVRYYIRVDRVNYSDGWHPEDCPGGVDLWPREADGGGESLSRKVSTDYGNDVINWEAAVPSPGVINP
jgi:hypothetical protein